MPYYDQTSHDLSTRPPTDDLLDQDQSVPGGRTVYRGVFANQPPRSRVAAQSTPSAGANPVAGSTVLAPQPLPDWLAKKVAVARANIARYAAQQPQPASLVFDPANRPLIDPLDPEPQPHPATPRPPKPQLAPRPPIQKATGPAKSAGTAPVVAPAPPLQPGQPKPQPAVLAPAQSTLRQPNWYYIAEHPAEYQDVDQQYQFGKDLYQQALDHLTPQQQQEIRNKRIAGYAENQKLDPKQALAEMYLNFTGVIPDAQLHPQLLRWKQQHSADWMNWPGIRQALAADLKYVGDPYEEGKEIMGNAAGDAISGAARKVMGYSDKEQTPWINAVSHFVGHMATDPMNYLYGAVIPGGVIGRAANTIFATQMAAGTVQTAGQLGAILDRSDIPLQQKYDLAANAILGSIMAAHSAGNAIKGDKLPIDQRLLNEITRLGDEAKRQIFARVEQRLMRQEAPRSAPDRAAKAPVKSRVPASANTPKTNAQAAKTAAVLSRPDLSPDQKHEVIADGILQQVTASPAGPAAPRPVASPQLAPEVKTMLDYEVAHGNIEPPQPAPKPQLALDPEKIAAIGPALDWLSHADRQGVVVKLHGKLTSAIAEQGKLLGPDGQLHITNSPAEAAKLAQQLINDSISEHDQRVTEPISKPDLLRAAAPSVSEAQRVASAGAAGSQARPSADTRNVPEMGHNMTADAPAVRRAKAQGRPVRGEEPTIKVKREPPEIQARLSQPPAPVTAEDAARIGQRDPQSGRPILQPSNDVVQNERLANQAAPDLNTRLSRIAAGIQGAKFERLRPQKGLERLEEKVTEGKPPRTIGDNLSAQLSVRNERVKDQVVARLQREFPVISVDDHFLEPREKAGYPSTNVQVKLPNGSTAEVQIVAREVQKITDRTHQYYTLGRNYAEGSPERTYYWEQAAALNRQALERYHARVAAEKAAEGLAPGQRVVLTNGLTGKIVGFSKSFNRVTIRTRKGLRTVKPAAVVKTFWNDRLQVASSGQGVRQAVIVRPIKRGEKMTDLLGELMARTWDTELEHGIITLKNGQRYMVSGGPGGINFDPFENDLRRVVVHTHSKPGGISDHDHRMLEKLGQKNSYIYEMFGAGITKFRRKR